MLLCCAAAPSPTPGDATPAPTIAPAEPAQGKNEARFVGSPICAECHAEAYARWQTSHHARAMQRATEQTVLGDFDDVSFAHAPVASRFFRRDGKYLVRTDGPDGGLVDFEIEYTFGVDPLQQYLVELPGGRYQALSVAWSTRKREWFHLYPDESLRAGDVLHWTGAAQNWNSMCADCHSTNVQRNYDLKTKQYATTWSEISVGCEACHGPGSAHVAWAKDEPKSRPSASPGLSFSMKEPVKATWVFEDSSGIAKRRPQRTSDVEVQTCGGCHSRRTPLAAPYVLGQPLLATHRVALLEEGLYHADGQVDDEVYVYGSFVQSKMYRAGVTCSDCHDSHGGRVRAADNALCARCHSGAKFDTRTHHFHPEGSGGSRCVDCHMPAKSFMVVHPRRDHSFRVPRPELSRKVGAPDACTGCHTDRGQEWAEKAIDGWRREEKKPEPHYGEAIHAGRHWAADAEPSLTRLADDAAQPAIARATAAALLGRYASPASLATIERAAKDGDPLMRLGALEALAAVDPETRLRLAFPLLGDPMLAVRVAAVPVATSVPSELMTAPQRASVEASVGEYRAAQMVSADRPGAHVAMGVVHAQLGDLDAARAAYQTALDTGSYFVPAYVNLADLERLEQRDGEGEKLLRRALAIAPDSAEVHHALGLLLARARRTDEAVVALRRAAELDADDPGYAYVYAIALNSTGRSEAALHVLEEAHRRFPAHGETLAALVTINAERGAFDKATMHAERLVALRPQDPWALQLLERIRDASQAPR